MIASSNWRSYDFLPSLTSRSFAVEVRPKQLAHEIAASKTVNTKARRKNTRMY